MGAKNVEVRRWPSAERPTWDSIRKILADEGLQPYVWKNDPGDAYSAHDHPYHKVIYVVQGSITFGLPESGERLALNAGDRLDLPAGVMHDAIVGPDGVVCLEAHC